VLLALAALTVAPPAKWSSDRSLVPQLTPLTHRRSRKGPEPSRTGLDPPT
jgi:hypothetical protein